VISANKPATAAKQRPAASAARRAAPKKAATVRSAARAKTPVRVVKSKPMSAEMIQHAAKVGQAAGGHLGQGFTKLCQDWAAQIKKNKALDAAGRQYLDMFVKMANWLDQ
jgi:hypothetical protein